MKHSGKVFIEGLLLIYEVSENKFLKLKKNDIRIT